MYGVKHVSSILFHSAQIPEKLIIQKVGGLSASLLLFCDSFLGVGWCYITQVETLMDFQDLKSVE